MRKFRELLLTAAFVALVVIGIRVLEDYSSRPLIYLEGIFPTYIVEEGWLYAVRYTVDGVPMQMYAATEARATRFTAYLRRVGRVINDEPKGKSNENPRSEVDVHP